MMSKVPNRLRLLLCLPILFCVACAHSAGSYKPAAPLKEGFDLKKFPSIVVGAKANSGVPMTEADCERLVNKVNRKLNEGSRYKILNTASSEPATLYVNILITNYDEGNAALRFLLAGLGQIHIDGTLTLEDSSRTSPLATYDLNKTFAWGGMLGHSTTIEHVEEGFAQTIADILLEKP